MASKLISKLFLLSAALVLPSGAGAPNGPQDPRAVAVEAINSHPPFLVRVEVDRLKRLYKGGEVVQVKVRSEKAGHLYLFYCDVEQKVSLLFPNKFQTDNKIFKGEPVTVPHARSSFRLRVGAPFGWEVLTAVVTTRPLEIFKKTDISRADITPLTVEQFRGVFAECQKPDGPHPERDWAEHHVSIFTYDSAKPSVEAQKLLRSSARRVGLFVGLSQYNSRQIRKLATAHKDAAALAEVMQRHCRLDQVTVLTNQQATLRALEEQLRKKLPAATLPGDTVFLYWSGHGGRCAGDTPTGHSEFLVPYDGSLASLEEARKTMLLDETFGRWLQQLDGRRVVLIFDACYSAGVARDPKEKVPFSNFLESFWQRARDLGHKDLALLASSQATQISFQRRERDHSVMTYYLLEKLKKAEGPLNLGDAFHYVKERVPNYVAKTYPGQTQTPVLIPEDDRTPLRVGEK